jgi:hypothetical protein
VKLNKGDKVMSLASEKIYEVAEDMADDDECVKLFAPFRLGSTVQWITTTAPTNNFIKIK